jgi:hypothetical protein
MAYYDATLLYGIPLEEEEHVTKKSVTRYHETTGEPYQKDDSETTYVTVVKGTSISVEDDGFINEALMENDMFHGYNGPRFIGIRIANADPREDEAVDVSFDTVDNETLRFDLQLMLSKYFDPAQVEEMMKHAGLFLYGSCT